MFTQPKDPRDPSQYFYGMCLALGTWVALYYGQIWGIMLTIALTAGALGVLALWGQEFGIFNSLTLAVVSFLAAASVQVGDQTAPWNIFVYTALALDVLWIVIRRIPFANYVELGLRPVVPMVGVGVIAAILTVVLPAWGWVSWIVAALLWPWFVWKYKI